VHSTLNDLIHHNPIKALKIKGFDWVNMLKKANDYFYA
jgi:hypothetical protein